MDPITVATKRFLKDLERFWKRAPQRIARLVAQAEDRKQIITALRIAEHSITNRRPLFLYEAPFDSAPLYFDKLVEEALGDYELVRRGAAEEGVTLAEMKIPTRSSTLSPEIHAHTVLMAISERLATKLDGAVLALVPKAVLNASAWRKSVERLAKEDRSPMLRIAIFDPDEGIVESVLGTEGARFQFDIDELFDYAQKQGNQKSAGPQIPPGPALSPAQQADFEESTGSKLAPPETMAELRSLFLEGARAAAKKDFQQAGQYYRRARDLSHEHGLAGQEVAAAFALGGASLAGGNRPLAQAMYGQAALLGAQSQLWTISCQAKLGEAGVGWMEKDYGRAGRAYAEAALLAERGSLVPLRIEALRMEGICHQQRGAEADAIVAFRKAIDSGTSADEPTRAASTFAEVVKTLATLLDARGLRPQADHLRTLLPTEK